MMLLRELTVLLMLVKERFDVMELLIMLVVLMMGSE